MSFPDSKPASSTTAWWPASMRCWPLREMNPWRCRRWGRSHEDDGWLSWLPWLGLIPVGWGGIAGFRRWRRYRRRNCPQCHTRMALLSDSDDDELLEKGQVAEERIGSVDYDVWKCPSCSHHFTLRYAKWLSSYDKCPQCSNRTKSSIENVITPATTSSSGSARVLEQCAFCSFTREYTKTLPRISQSSSSSSGSSGGSSFGGGSSGGGGASRAIDGRHALWVEDSLTTGPRATGRSDQALAACASSAASFTVSTFQHKSIRRRIRSAGKTPSAKRVNLPSDRISHRVFDAADGMLDELLQSPAVLHRHRDAHLILMDGGIGDGRHAVAQRHHRRIACPRSLNSLMPAAPRSGRPRRDRC